MTRRNLLNAASAASAAALFVTLTVSAQEIDSPSIEKIKDEGMNRSRVMETASYLTDVYGPRLSGSPGIKAAGEWAVTRMKQWGLTGVALEPWESRRGFDRGWSNDKFYLAAVAPTPFPINGTPTAWTPGTNGLVRGEVVCVTGTSEADLAPFRGKLRGKFVIGAPTPNVQAFFDQPLAARQTSEQLERLAAARAGGARGAGAPPTAPAPGRAAAPAGAPPGAATPVAPAAIAPALPAVPPEAACAQAPQPPPPGQAAAAGRGAGGPAGPPAVPPFNRNDFFRAEGVVATLSTVAIGHGFYTIGGNRAGDPATTLPAITIPAEQYGRIARTLAKGIPVVLEADVKNTFYPNPEMFNVVGEIRGIDKAD
jgi:carboxypeptidase Q